MVRRLVPIPIPVHFRIIMDLLPLLFIDGIRLWDSRKQSPGVRMHGILKLFVGIRHLHQLSIIHHADPVRKVLDHRQVMGNEENGQPHLLLQLV